MSKVDLDSSELSFGSSRFTNTLILLTKVTREVTTGSRKP
jgi:hypothetical protein